MTAECWDPDQAVNRGPLDDALQGRRSDSRYGVTELEEICGEPLDVALAQEERDDDFDSLDDQWVFVEGDWDLAPRRRADDYGDAAAEELAMHVVEM
jgi:hypothetical protein